MAEDNKVGSLAAQIQALEMRKAFHKLTPEEEAELTRLKQELARRKAGF